jgi:hypothetical protein
VVDHPCIGQRDTRQRVVLQALLVLDYLIKNGSKQVIVDARQHLPNIQTLTTYQHIDTSDNDVGQSGTCSATLRRGSRVCVLLLTRALVMVMVMVQSGNGRGPSSSC